MKHHLSSVLRRCMTHMDLYITPSGRMQSWERDATSKRVTLLSYRPQYSTDGLYLSANQL